MWQEAEMGGISPEEVYAAIVCCGSSIKPCVWLKSELPHLLDEICAIAASVQLSCPAGGDETCPEGGDKEERPQQSDGPEAAGASVKLSRAEAKVAWLAAGGNTDRAVRQLLRDRQRKVRATTQAFDVVLKITISRRKMSLLRIWWPKTSRKTETTSKTPAVGLSELCRRLWIWQQKRISCLGMSQTFYLSIFIFSMISLLSTGVYWKTSKSRF